MRQIATAFLTLQQSLHPAQHRGVIIDDENEVPIWQE
jgi:hypothetical protein